MQADRRTDPTDRKTILLIDDHVLLADTVSAALMETGSFEVLSANTLADAEELIASHGAFDVVLMDYDLPDTRGLQGLRDLIAANGGGVALFSGVAGRAVALEAIEFGALGFIPKTLPLRILAHALQFIAAGETYLPSDLMRRNEGPTLKPREEKVLALLSEGWQNKEIALAAGITETTVKNDVKSLCKKLDARNRTDLVVSARSRGLV